MMISDNRRVRLLNDRAKAASEYDNAKSFWLLPESSLALPVQSRSLDVTAISGCYEQALVGGKLGSSGEKIDINDTVEVYMASVHCFDVVVSIVGLSMDQRIVDTTVVDQQSQGRKGSSTDTPSLLSFNSARKRLLWATLTA
jgi:hypothetical protein